ncbi:uncharacterized protein C8A04DRAFT_31083 [Dichotomopilus funicola]|uniref:Uncharacterized protein n=1 Tax=Dichotomopilus funicola TaxID=1934379 RepID=A0AAN6UY29_9PEZI|nr:hypothetical protein C8A04DRAFT_31083 [Dichotomopilus funicola]
MAGSSNDRAQRIIEEALLRHLTIDRSKHKQLVRNVIKHVFADGHNSPAEEAKKGFFQQLDAKALVALAVLIRVRDIQGNSVSTIERLCKNFCLIPTTSWYNDLDLWKTTLDVVSNSAPYLRFRKDIVDAIQQAESPCRSTLLQSTPAQSTPAQSTPATPFGDADVNSGPIEAFTCCSCNAKWPQRGIVASEPETASAESDRPFKRPCTIASPTTRSPLAPAAASTDITNIPAPVDAIKTPAQPSRMGGSYDHVLGKRKRPEDTPSTTFRVPSISSDLSVAPLYPELVQAPFTSLSQERDPGTEYTPPSRIRGVRAEGLNGV